MSIAAPLIHPTAIVATTAKLGRNVRVNPYAIIEDDVEIGDHCVIEAYAMVRSYTILGQHNHLHPHTVVGGLPQDLQFNPALRSYLRIGDHNTLREGATIHRSTIEEGATCLGSNNYLMNNTHVAHDCVLEDNCILATGVALGGFVRVEHGVFIGGGAMIHQFCRIGRLSMIRGITGVSKDVLPYTMLGGFPVKHYRLNLIGLRRAGMSNATIKAISTAFRQLKQQQTLQADTADPEELSYLHEWLAQASRRGIHAFIQH